MSKVIELKVSSVTVPAKFAGSLVKNLNEGKEVSAKALGMNALYKMIKGIAIAELFVQQNERNNETPKRLVSSITIENYDSEDDDSVMIGFVVKLELI